MSEEMVKFLYCKRCDEHGVWEDTGPDSRKCPSDKMDGIFSRCEIKKTVEFKPEDVKCRKCGETRTSHLRYSEPMYWSSDRTKILSEASFTCHACWQKFLIKLDRESTHHYLLIDKEDNFSELYEDKDSVESYLQDALQDHYYECNDPKSSMNDNYIILRLEPWDWERYKEDSWYATIGQAHKEWFKDPEYMKNFMVVEDKLFTIQDVIDIDIDYDSNISISVY